MSWIRCARCAEPLTWWPDTVPPATSGRRRTGRPSRVRARRRCPGRRAVCAITSSRAADSRAPARSVRSDALAIRPGRPAGRRWSILGAQPAEVRRMILSAGGFGDHRQRRPGQCVDVQHQAAAHSAVGTERVDGAGRVHDGAVSAWTGAARPPPSASDRRSRRRSGCRRPAGRPPPIGAAPAQPGVEQAGRQQIRGQEHAATASPAYRGDHVGHPRPAGGHITDRHLGADELPQLSCRRADIGQRHRVGRSGRSEHHPSPGASPPPAAGRCA